MPRFYDRLLGHYLGYLNAMRDPVKRRRIERSEERIGEMSNMDGWKERWNSYATYYNLLIDPNTKRMVFDSRQAKQFDDIGEGIPRSMVGKIHAPFDQFYVEFTEPITLGEQEPGQLDQVRGMMLVDEFAEVTMPWEPPDGSEVKNLQLKGSQLIVFLTSADLEGDGEPHTFVDRTFMVSLDLGVALTRVGVAMAGDKDTSTLPIPEGMSLNPDMYIVAGQPSIHGDRHVGWWERTISDYTTLFMWMMAYTMAKGIEIVEEPLSRQQRRWAERQKDPPKPWHIVRVEPKFYPASRQPIEDTGRGHSYRYDVIGHLRFGRHKRGDGTYSETIEWVPPHQRGLKNTLYIPKTYKVDGGRVMSERMGEYWKEES